ncbi:MAG: UvrD-helicase domain-containing protein [Lentisphaeria bacterium]|nr:UvrD-helicase domain-containing protein [Lentisphaeria bacterium]
MDNEFGENVFQEEGVQLSACNEAIMASAGTGKTFSLAMRYITLLNAGVPPGRILACTFTKKAAGEIFDKIAEELILLASSEEKAKERAEQFPLLKQGHFDAKRAGKILGTLLKSTEKLPIGTLDSFFVNIIRAFPLECGVFGELSIMEESDTRERVKTLLELLREIPQEDRREIRETVKDASYGESGKYLYGTIRDLIFDLYDRFLICPGEKFWCSEELRNLVPGDYFCSGETLEKITQDYSSRAKTFLEENNATESAFKALLPRFDSFAEDALSAKDNPKTSDGTDKFWELLAGENPGFPAMDENTGELFFSYRRRVYSLSGDLRKDTVILARHILACNMEALRRRNEALWRLLDLFNRKYALLVRSSGKITFADIPYLLRPSEDGRGADLALPFSGRAGIEERLDEKTDHYLIDEFQDTSDSQWNAISRLADEAITDPGGGRSFFYVGDIKQSIYQWRHGNPGLFDMILKKYPQELYGERGIRKRTLTKSYRSCPEVLEMVNTLFLHPEIPGGINAADEEKQIVSDAMKKMQFEEHVSSDSAAAQKGYSAFFLLPAQGRRDAKEAQEEKYRKVYDLLAAIDPFREDLPFSVGVLFRSNGTASEFAESIRKFVQEDHSSGKEVNLPVSLDSRIPVMESPLCVLACQLLLGAAHPGNPFVKKMFEMLEYGPCFQRLDHAALARKMGYAIPEGVSGESALFRGVRQDLADGGFERFFRRFAEAFRGEITPSSERRLAALTETARACDLRGMGDVDAFLETAEKEAGNEISLRSTVQCMTYHKSKGLAFDIVILPDISGESMSGVKFHKGVFLNKDPEDFSPRFLTAFPKTTMRKSVPLLNEFASALKNANAYENCCMLYVGMTRAKHALYLFGNKRGENAGTINMSALCEAAFRKKEQEGEETQEKAASGKKEKKKEVSSGASVSSGPLWTCGDPLWYEAERGEKGAESGKGAEKKENEDPVSGSRHLAEECLSSYLDACGKAVPEGGRILFPAKAGLDKAQNPSFHGIFAPSSGTRSFSLSGTAADLGTKVHELFSRIPFCGDGDPEAFLKGLFTEKELQSEEGKLLVQAWKSPALRDAMKHPGTCSASLRREQAFLLPDREKGNFVSGVFDRLVAEYDENGVCTGATVIDFKSDQEEDEAVFLRKYSFQLNTYREAAARLLKLAPERVKCRILALRSGKVIPVPL